MCWLVSTKCIGVVGVRAFACFFLSAQFHVALYFLRIVVWWDDGIGQSAYALQSHVLFWTH